MQEREGAYEAEWEGYDLPLNPYSFSTLRGCVDQEDINIKMILVMMDNRQCWRGSFTGVC
jgi:hypothetical protein